MIKDHLTPLSSRYKCHKILPFFPFSLAWVFTILPFFSFSLLSGFHLWSHVARSNLQHVPASHRLLVCVSVVEMMEIFNSGSNEYTDWKIREGAISNLIEHPIQLQVIINTVSHPALGKIQKFTLISGDYYSNISSSFR